MGVLDATSLRGVLNDLEPRAPRLGGLQMLWVIRDACAVKPGVIGTDHVDVVDAGIVGDLGDERLRAELSDDEAWPTARRRGIAMAARRERDEYECAHARYWITTWLIGATFMPPG